MSSLIDLKHPYELKEIKSIDEYLFVLKNILRIASQKKVKEKPNGLSIPVRWSNLHEDFVVDFGSSKQRDISGIHLNNLRLHYAETSITSNSIVCVLKKVKNCSKSDMLFEKYNLKKNENRFFNFVVDNDKIYLTGLYNRCQNLKRTGIYSNKNKKSVLIDNSEEFLALVKSELDFIELPEAFFLSEKYNKIYLDFLEKIENEILILNESESLEVFFKLKEQVHKAHDKNKITINHYLEILNRESNIKEKKVFWFLIYHLTLMFNNILLKSLNRTNISNIIVYDNVSDEFIKIVSSFNINKTKKEKYLKAPLLPMSF
jgi:hypothetical protein